MFLNLKFVCFSLKYFHFGLATCPAFRVLTPNENQF